MGIKEWMDEPTIWNKKQYEKNKEAFIIRKIEAEKTNRSLWRGIFMLYSVLLICMTLVYVVSLIVANR
jgi:glycopeptide antibiotics resistance protein